ncbi:MAG TPA: 6-phospho-beta-glucosidase [Actinophytocola sp.]|uniref:family 4 glycosyl hydrolase n=1 Tax=Actinophytocola sp. TaxID=1872138 RepID=UPI002DDD72D7|nr:6-phospho-beta-glucosidase [Actinophytocola sp.]HEV2784355.1 6-phospho-beta-glucosidase [Actinophytocola sp.]
MKVAVVGGGSTYTPELIDGFARLRGQLGAAGTVDELVLIDPATDRLDVIGPFGRRIFARYGHPGTLTWTADLDAGVSGADVVLIQLRVGGQRARISDETFPGKVDSVGQETVGAGGLAKALRTVPVVLDVARRARARAADGAWIIAFTNPVGIVTRALLDDGHRAVGLCNVAIGLQRRFAALLDVPPDSVLLDHVGLNHLTWERAAVVDGVDRLPELLAEHGKQLAEQVQIPQGILELTGTVPSYYLRYFYCHDEVVAEQRRTPTRGARVADIERELLAMYADPTLDTKPALLSERGGAFYSEAAVGLLASLRGDDGGVHAANVRNDGTFATLPDDAVIEVSCAVGANGALPLPTSPLAPDIAGLVAHHSGYEELAFDAARRGGRDRVFHALLAHPLIGQADLADRLTDQLLAANAAYLGWA